MQVGDKVYLKPTGNRARYEYQDKSIREYEIKKVGRKYLEVWENNKEFSIVKFNIEDKREVTNYSPEWILYFSKQEILDEEESKDIIKEIRKSLGEYGLPNNICLDKLKRIRDIINE